MILYCMILLIIHTTLYDTDGYYWILVNSATLTSCVRGTGRWVEATWLQGRAFWGLHCRVAIGTDYAVPHDETTL